MPLEGPLRVRSAIAVQSGKIFDQERQPGESSEYDDQSGTSVYLMREV